MFEHFKIFGVKCFPFVIYIIISVSCGFAMFNFPENKISYTITSVETDSKGSLIAKVKENSQKIAIDKDSYNACKPNCVINKSSPDLEEFLLFFLSLIFGIAGFVGFIEITIE